MFYNDIWAKIQTRVVQKVDNVIQRLNNVTRVMLKFAKFYE